MPKRPAARPASPSPAQLHKVARAAAMLAARSLSGPSGLCRECQWSALAAGRHAPGCPVAELALAVAVAIGEGWTFEQLHGLAPAPPAPGTRPGPDPRQAALFEPEGA